MAEYFAGNRKLIDYNEAQTAGKERAEPLLAAKFVGKRFHTISYSGNRCTNRVVFDVRKQFSAKVRRIFYGSANRSTAHYRDRRRGA